MKINKITVAALGMAALLSGCTSGFGEDNRPGNKVSLEELGRDDYAVSSFITELENVAFPENENAYQHCEDLIGNYLGRYMTYVNTSFSIKNFTCFNAEDKWIIIPWRDIYPKAMSSTNEISILTQKQGPMYALSLILNAQFILRFTDTFGPLPLGLEEDSNAYSNQESIYKHLLSNLDKAIEILNPLIKLNPELTVKPEADKVYEGKMAKWVKFANSLKLRMAVRMRFVEPELAQQVAETAVKAGVIESNEDNCYISYSPNGLYKTSVDWGDTRACADLESYMTGYNDPRMSKYFLFPEDWTRGIIGCRAGANVTNKDLAMKKYSAVNIQPDSKGIWLTAAEMAFCKAEGALLHWNMGDEARQLYEKAITLSFQQWGVYGIENYLNDNQSTQNNYTDANSGYGEDHIAMSSITIKWNDDDSMDKKMERLIVQKWIALFPDGQEAWNEIRRTGYPKVFPVAQATNGYNLTVPNRIPLDPREITGNNKVNYQKAVEMLGGKDDYAAKMWWQNNK